MAVAYSGGRDSTALLHATLAAARPLGVDVLALHVHHGLSIHADAWLEHCTETCSRWSAHGNGLRFASRRVTSSPLAGDSVEAWARTERYAALREMAVAGNAHLVLLAQHRRDQAETFLLQALRSSGVKGLAAMPKSAVRDGLTWARPWLEVPGDAVDRYARENGLTWVEDESNVDPRFARGRLRRHVWPALLKSFPDAEAGLSTAARRAGAAAAVIEVVAQTDLRSSSVDGKLQVAAWRTLPVGRQGHALRAWIASAAAAPAPGSLVDRMMREVDADRTQRWHTRDLELRSYRGVLSCEPRPSAVTPTVTSTSTSTPTPTPTSAGAFVLDARSPGSYRVNGWCGELRVEQVEQGGIPASMAVRLTLRRRAAGDRFQSGPGRPARSLKLQFQSASVPASQRNGPIVSAGDVLVFVQGLGLDARAASLPGQPRVSLSWHEDPPTATLAADRKRRSAG